MAGIVFRGTVVLPDALLPDGVVVVVAPKTVVVVVAGVMPPVIWAGRQMRRAPRKRTWCAASMSLSSALPAGGPEQRA